MTRTQALQLILALDAQQLDLEDQGSVLGNARGTAAGTIGLVIGDVELELITNSHVGNTIGPSLENQPQKKTAKKRWLSTASPWVGGYE